MFMSWCCDYICSDRGCYCWYLVVSLLLCDITDSVQSVFVLCVLGVGCWHV